MRVFVPRDSDLLKAVVEVIYEVHSYYEPPMTVTEVLRSQTKGLDDSKTRIAGGTRTATGKRIEPAPLSTFEF